MGEGGRERGILGQCDVMVEQRDFLLRYEVKRVKLLVQTLGFVTSDIDGKRERQMGKKEHDYITRKRFGMIPRLDMMDYEFPQSLSTCMARD